MRRAYLVALTIAAASLLAGLLAGCGDAAKDGEQTAESSGVTGSRAGSPAEAVAEFARVAGGAGVAKDEGRKRLEKACALLSDDVRGAMQFEKAAQESPANCAAALSLSLYYAGDNGELPQPKGFRVKVGKIAATGRRASVSIRVTFETDKGSRSYPSKVLVVRGKRGWAVATPQTLGILAASQGVDDAQLAQSYRELRGAAGKADRTFEEGRQASSEVSGDIEACLRDGGSERQDPGDDARYNDRMRADKRKKPPASADLTRVRHNADGNDLCFELTYADDAPAKGAANIKLLPDSRELSVSWDTNGKVLGQYRKPGSEDISAVPVKVARDGDRVAIRFAKTALDQGGGGYRWAVESFVATPEGSNAYYDTVPQDLTIDPNRGDQYVRQP